ncbi:hypothetical protein GCM10023321_15810 [Pseudonocardia eucalypti]|uniref:Uncharacterized protein n=1 Tax=Pseudonocardia eucalypti TaxID=648755 RepID=A0ABP9PQG7_9PSEU|nr:hypothetical protein [Pseudonocardia eucalypti]
MSTAFDELLREATAGGERFGHREHVHLTWLAVRRFGTAGAVDLVGAGIRRAARDAGRPGKYHATITRAWVELVGHHVAEDPVLDFATFAIVEANAPLLDRGLLARFYRPETLAGAQARAGWVEPDRSPFPWRGPTA